MFDQSVRQALEGAFDQALALMAVPCIWQRQGAPDKTIQVGFKTVTDAEQELANAYGVGTKLFTVSTKDAPDLAKFDLLFIGTNRYVIDSLVPVYLNGVQVFWKAISKGDR